MKKLRIGYALSSEEHAAADLVRNAAAAQKTGFSFAFISDHYHPWVDKQGNSPFVWSTLGAISQATSTISVGTGVTCPIVRIHPTIIAQSAATVASLMEGRFMLGLGTGENLNEHIIGEGWPPIEIRQEMLVEAIEIIRLLWQGGVQSYHGEYFIVDHARVYSLPKKLPPILVAAAGVGSSALAGELADGFVGTSPNKDVISVFNETGGRGKPKYGLITVCYAKTQQEAVKTAHEWWPNGALKGPFKQDLRVPASFEDAAATVRPDDVAAAIVCGPDPKKHLQKIKEYAAAGYDNVYIHQVGPDQSGFFKFYESHILPVFN